MDLFFTKSLFHTPPAFNAVEECLYVNPSMYSPLRHTHCLSIMCEKSVAAPVATLLFIRRPVAIGWPVVCDAFRTFSARIVTVVVSSLDAVFRSRLSPQIIVKLLERLPPFANSDIPTTVAMKTWIFRVVASLADAYPAGVLWCFRQTVRRSVLRVNFFHETPAAFRMSRAKAGTFQNRSCSAVALAMPKSFSASVETSIGQNSPATEVVAPSQVFHAWWNSNRIICSHLNLLNRFKVVRATQRVMTVGLLAFYRICFAEPSGKWR